MSVRRSAISSMSLVLILGCGASPQPEFATIALPGPAQAAPLPPPKTPPEELPGVDTTKLSAREKREWWNLVSQLYAPCSEQAVSIAQCVKEERNCPACAPAARLVAAKVQNGATKNEIERAYGVRFGPNVHKVEVADSPSKGPEDAPVTLMIWTDFECPHCRMTMPLVEAVLEKYSSNVRLVHKFYPLQQHTNSEPAARAAIAANRQGRFWEMEKLIFDHQGDLEPKRLEELAKSLELDMKRFRSDMEASSTKESIERDKADADRCGLMGTPFLLINGREFDLAYFQPDRDLDPWITTELEILGIAH